MNKKIIKELRKILKNYHYDSKEQHISKDVVTSLENLLGLIFICAWISSAGIGESFFESFSVFLKSFIGKFILIGFTWSMSYHLLSGIRHFFWDLGYGYEIKTANLSGIIVVIGSLFLTIILWMVGKGLI